jgi:hypothetical protein
MWTRESLQQDISYVPGVLRQFMLIVLFLSACLFLTCLQRAFLLEKSRETYSDWAGKALFPYSNGFQVTIPVLVGEPCKE